MMLTHNPQAVEGFRHLGYPEYFMTYLGLAKLLAVIAIIYRRIPVLTEWAYAGLTFTFLAASYSHCSSGDPMSMVIPPLVFLGILMGSRHLGRRQDSSPSARNDGEDRILRLRLRMTAKTGFLAFGSE